MKPFQSRFWIASRHCFAEMRRTCRQCRKPRAHRCWPHCMHLAGEAGAGGTLGGAARFGEEDGERLRFWVPSTKHHQKVGRLALQTRKLRVARHRHPDGRNRVENMTAGILAEVRQRGGQAGSSSSGNHCSMLAIKPLAALAGGEEALRSHPLHPALPGPAASSARAGS